MSDTSWIGPAMQMAIAVMGEEKASKLNQQQLAALARQYADIQGVQLPDLPAVTADQMGPSAVGGMVSDENLRAKQLQAMGEIQNIIDSGGLDLSDKATLEEAMAAAANQQRRARAGVAADAAERGQMNSGNRLVMDMDAAQKGANAARSTGLETAGMAQRRKLQAIQDSAKMAGGLREQDWREEEAAKRAQDFRDERNATAREKAQYHNAGLAQQQFGNAMAKATGSLPSASLYASGLGGAANDARASAAGMGNIANQAAQGGGGTPQPAYSDNGGAYTYQHDADLNGERGGYADLTKDDPDFK